jgi:hypothetical protein
VIALNGQELKLVKVQGVFFWHYRDDADEPFMVSCGRFRVEHRAARCADLREILEEISVMLLHGNGRANHCSVTGRSHSNPGSSCISTKPCAS